MDRNSKWKLTSKLANGLQANLMGEIGTGQSFFMLRNQRQPQKDTIRIDLIVDQSQVGHSN